MSLLSRLSLRQMLTLPYVMLVLVLAGIIGTLSYQAGRDALDNLSGQLLTETVDRIAQAVEMHVSGSAAVLETAFPTGVRAPEDIDADMDNLRTRFWLATSVHLDPNNYAYYGDRRGQFFGLWRFSEREAELRLRTSGQGPRTIYRFTDIEGPLRDPVEESRIFDPRERPWFQRGQETRQDAWTAIYIDFKTGELVATRARRVNDANGSFHGVVATDLSLGRVNDFLRTLPLSENGYAFVVEDDGNLIGTSRGRHLRLNENGENTRLHASSTEDVMISDTYHQVARLQQVTGGASSYTGFFEDINGRTVQVAYSRLQDLAGLDWTIVVAVPRSDFLYRVEQSFRQTAILGFIASLIVILIGLSVLNAMTRELRSLAHAARRMGEGELETPLNIDRTDELGELAQSFANMQHRLMTDRLTELANREAITRRIEDRILQQRRQGDPRPFALLFIDLNDFKNINDQYGHDIGDEALKEMGQRMLQNVRAGDSVARYAGDEFLVLLDSVANLKDANNVREKLNTALNAPLHCLPPSADNEKTSEGSTGASIGLALFPEDGLDVNSLIKAADEDMYTQKKDPTA